MSEEKKETRINIEDLPQPEQELTDEEAKEVQGGAGITKLGSKLLTLNNNTADDTTT